MWLKVKGHVIQNWDCYGTLASLTFLKVNYDYHYFIFYVQYLVLSVCFQKPIFQSNPVLCENDQLRSLVVEGHP